MTAARLYGSGSDEQQRRVIEAVNGLSHADLARLGAWASLAELSSQTVFEGVDVNTDSIIIRADDRFEALADVYVTLNYGGGDEEASLSDGYPATVRGHIEGDMAVVDQVELDTGSFYN